MEKRGKSPLAYHYGRNFWLLIFGFAHMIFIWEGDVLMVYAACAFVLYWLRKLPSKWQFGLGLLIFFVPSLLNLWINTTLPQMQPADLQYLESYWQPEETAVSSEIAYYRSPYFDQLSDWWAEDTDTSPTTTAEQLLEISALTEFFLRALGMMLIGMAFYTWGILTAKRSDEFYTKMAFIGFGVGLPAALISLYQYTVHDWGAWYSLFNGRIPNHIATPFIASGYIALIMLWSRSNTLANFRDKLAVVGRMALTNYIGQSLIGTFIFYGFGFGLIGSLNRVQQFLIILLIWTFQIFFSSWWLSRFQYGPLEWIWRMLSHRRWQPIQKKPVVQVVGD
jgi:uncharacterized protein